MENNNLDVLLAKNRLTFYWGAIDKKWWIIGKPEHGCAQNSIPEAAKCLNDAQVCAIRYILKKYTQN